MRAPSAAGSIRRLPHNSYHGHYLIKFSEFNALYRKAQIFIVKRIAQTLANYFFAQNCNKQNNS